jgi:hypothetical protein
MNGWRLMLPLVLFFFSCDRSDPALFDEIVSSKIQLNNELWTVESYTVSLNPNCTNLIPVPKDSIVYRYLDLDADSISDFKITAQHGAFYNVMMGHCGEPLTYLISVEGLNGAFVAMDTLKISAAYQLDSMQCISDSLAWKQTGFLKMDGDALGLLLERTQIEKRYIGLKFQNKFAWLKFEPMERNGIKLLEYGVNNTHGNSIRAGQAE